MCKKAIIAAEWTKGRVLGEFSEEEPGHIIVFLGFTQNQMGSDWRAIDRGVT